jgi:hypothetical protein
MSILNSNSITNVTAILAGVVAVVPKLVGCTVDATTHVAACADSWVGPAYAPWLAFALGVIAFVSASFGSGTITQNLFAKVVPVVEHQDAAPGVVTQAQVDTPHA